jgi:serine/threonine-protein kinase HipA
MRCHIQIYRQSKWQTAGIFEPEPGTLDRGVLGGGRFQYDFDYALAHLGEQEAELIPGLKVGFDLRRFEHWPGFLVDMLPGGAGRMAWLKRLQVPRDGAHMDWHMLTRAATNPPGHLRIEEALVQPPPNHFKSGFPKQAILEQREDFLDYAEERGAFVSGASSVQGEAPKYLLVEDEKGLFHAEGALPDKRTKKFWLVKFARGKRSNPLNQQVIRNEAPYLEVARAFGIRVGEPLQFQRGALFVPRFDREVVEGKVLRFGLHSLYALANVPGFGTPVRHETMCRQLAESVSDPVAELREYLLRDILNLALRNTDNHGRNSAILRKETVSLSPLFDFAPMFLDPEGIGRVCRWQDEIPGNQPDWRKICRELGLFANQLQAENWLQTVAGQVQRLPETMRSCGVDEDIIGRLQGWILQVAHGLM